MNLNEVPIKRGIFTLYVFEQKSENPASTWYKITMTSEQTKMREMEGLNHFFSSSCSSRFFSHAMWAITPIRNQCNQNDNMIIAEIAHPITAWFVLSTPAKEEKES